MKIGIITQVLLNNYGGVLQNYALQIVLKRMGHEPITLDYIPSKSTFRVILSLIITPFLYFTKKKRKIEDCLPCRRDIKFEQFISRKMSVTHQIDNYSSSIISEYNLNAIVVGSDQVWRPMYNEDVIYDTFLEFASDYKIKKIAYAASFGVSTWEYSKKQQIKCSELIKGFDAISVREETGIEMCEKYLGAKAQLVLDPTLLLSFDDYLSLLEEDFDSDNYILSYILNPSESIVNMISLKENELGVPSLSITIGRNNQYSIEEWLTFFYKSKFVVTDSFHGTVFSIIFHKEFIVLNNKSRGSARLQSLLKKLGLESRLIDEASGLLSLGHINWKIVDERLNNLRENSMAFLRSSLN